jgi:prepilin-type N-terminal cleavage/methylation domain-containing protein
MNSKRGFTLIELLVVISIISLLSSVVMSSLNSARDKARIASGRQLAAQAFRVAGELAVGVWDFNETVGSSAADRSGYNQIGTLSVGATWSSDTPGGSGRSVSFNGSSGFVEVPYSSALAPTPAVTFGAWIKPNNLSADQRVISKTQTGGYQLSFNEGTCPGEICGFVFVGGGYHVVRHPVSALTVGKWHHLMASYDGETFKLYLDGKEIGSNATPSGPIQYSIANALCIGNEPGATCTDGSFFNGHIDEVRIYAKSLTAREVGELYAISAPRYLAME